MSSRIGKTFGRDDFDRQFEGVYEDLREVARAQLRRNARPSTLDTTALIHEAYLKLSSARGNDFTDRDHFLATAARAMRFVLIDYARSRSADKRGGRQSDEPLDDDVASEVRSEIETLLALDVALEQLAGLNPRLVRVVECRYFGGYSDLETASVLGTSVRTVRRDWSLARAKLRTELTQVKP